MQFQNFYQNYTKIKKNNQETILSELNFEEQYGYDLTEDDYFKIGKYSTIFGKIDHENYILNSNKQRLKEQQPKKSRNVSGLQLRKMSDQDRNKLIRKYRSQFNQQPNIHTGISLTFIKCDKLKNKKYVYVDQKPNLINMKNYFNSRCDYILQNHINSKTDFIYTNSLKMAMDNFTPGKQIVNKIPKIRYYLSQKDIFAQALKSFDKKQIYNFDSSEFHLKAFHFNLNEPTYNKQERKFMDEINEGFWITKDPLGQNGYGITVFKDVQILKEKIQIIKQQSTSQNNSEIIKDEKIQIMQKEEGENYIDNKLNLDSNNQFAYVEEYMHNPFLWDNKKIDHRSFLLIASLNPLVVLYQDGFVKRCIDEYDNNFQEFDTQAIFKHITNRKQYKGKHPNYKKLEDELILTIPQLQDYMRKNYNFTDEQFENLQHEKHKMMAYCIMAIRDKLDPIQGAYTLLGFDFIWDENFKLKIIEINTVPELSGKLSAQKYVYPKLIQSTLDLIIDTLQEPSKTWEKWKNPNKLELGNWEIIINESQNYNVLDQYKIKN